MGILKGCLKIAGTAALTTTGIASKILCDMSDMSGFEIGSELFGAAKDASVNGIKNIWSSPNSENAEDCDDCEDYDDYDDDCKKLSFASMATDSINEFDTRKKLAETAKRAADTAKRNGNQELYEKYMEKYYEYKG